MKDFRPTILDYSERTWCFFGVSEKFDDLEEGEPFPQYDVLFTRKEDGTLTYEFKRI